MKFVTLFFLISSLVSPVSASAEESAADQANTLEAGMSQDTLSNEYSNWSSRYLDGFHSFGDRHAVFGEMRETSRFELIDHEISGGYYHPLSTTWTGLVNASYSPEHNVLPINSVLGQLQKSFDGGWNIQSGIRHSEYTGTYTDLLTLTGEHYWGDYRAAYSFFLGKPRGIGAAPSHMLQLSDYYGDHNYITLSLSNGVQVESLGEGLGVLTTHVLSSSISGHHWLNSRWGLSYEAVDEHQGNLYIRESIRIGLLYAF